MHGWFDIQSHEMSSFFGTPCVGSWTICLGKGLLWKNCIRPERCGVGGGACLGGRAGRQEVAARTLTEGPLYCWSAFCSVKVAGKKSTLEQLADAMELIQKSYSDIELQMAGLRFITRILEKDQETERVSVKAVEELTIRSVLLVIIACAPQERNVRAWEITFKM